MTAIWITLISLGIVSFCDGVYAGNTMQASGKGPAWDCADFRHVTRRVLPKVRFHIQYLLFTRGNRSCATVIGQDSAAHFNVSLPTRVIIHGYRVLGNKPSWINDLVLALLTAGDVNVIVVDWVYEASFAYKLVVNNYKEVAIEISKLISALTKLGSEMESFHLIGISLGAHVAGYVGTLFGGKLGRITALDAASLMFKDADAYDRLDPTDALFVEAIHTDSDKFGTSNPIGHVDFLLNGGKDQPGCGLSRLSSVYRYIICDHMRAVYVYISALNGSCPLAGFPCSSYEDFVGGSCLDCDSHFSGSCPQIGMQDTHGIEVKSFPEHPEVFLMTMPEAPFCAHHILLELEVKPLTMNGKISVTLRSSQRPDTQGKIQLRSNATSFKKVMAHPTALCQIDSIEMMNSGSWWYHQRVIHVEKLCMSELPYRRGKEALCVENIVLRRNHEWSHEFVELYTNNKENCTGW
ncbi:PLA1A Phospholipase, partial [Atractosteus spatula]|nr:PLA1A Phospholipase [Atractosteus spatula]